MYPQTQEQKHNTRILIISGILIIATIILFFIIQAILRIGKIKVNVQYAPFIAKVIIDDKPIRNNATHYLEPGEHSVRVTLEGLDELNTIVTINDNTKNIYGILTASTPEGEDILKKYQNDVFAVQSIYGELSITAGNQERSKWPIIDFLPVNNMLFTIGYTITSNNQLHIIIKTSSTYLNEAVAKIKSFDYSKKQLSTYNIAFEQWENPLENIFEENAESDPVSYLKAGYINLGEEYNLIINPGTLNDEYYYTTITTGLTEHYNLVTYKCILTHNNNSWKLVSTPSPILTTTNTPNIPIEILENANNL